MATRESVTPHETSNERRWVRGGVLLGLGLGGFFDGIVLHQILQWHHMVSSQVVPYTLRNLRINTLGDGLFHALTYVFTLTGVFLLWSGTRASRVTWDTARFVGTLLLGWGLFNLVEGTLIHQVLGLHHVRPGPNQLAYDLGFLAWGAAMVVLGWRLLQARR